MNPEFQKPVCITTSRPCEPPQNPPSNVDIRRDTADFGETLGTFKEYNRFAILWWIRAPIIP